MIHRESGFRGLKDFTIYWQCWLPEVRLLCKRGKSKKSKDFPALKPLTDAEQARLVLEQALRTQAAGYEQVSIHACAPGRCRKPARSGASSTRSRRFFSLFSTRRPR